MERAENFYRDVGLAILRLREDRGLTQETLASLVSLTRTSITNIEKGRQRFLVHTLVDIAHALGVSPAELLPSTSTNPESRLDELLAGLDESVQGWIKAAAERPSKRKR